LNVSVSPMVKSSFAPSVPPLVQVVGLPVSSVPSIWLPSYRQRFRVWPGLETSYAVQVKVRAWMKVSCASLLLMLKFTRGKPPDVVCEAAPRL
jgi:hypothetical protein